MGDSDVDLVELADLKLTDKDFIDIGCHYIFQVYYGVSNYDYSIIDNKYIAVAYNYYDDYEGKINLRVIYLKNLKKAWGKILLEYNKVKYNLDNVDREEFLSENLMCIDF
jgi:hypothetical protein